MRVLLYLSDLVIPFLFFYIIGHGLLRRGNIYQDFLDGARDGLDVTVKLVPTLIGLLVGVGILRASGFLDLLSLGIGKLTSLWGVPSEVIPVALVRLFSSSAATGLLLDIFKEMGTDSLAGLTGALCLSATESVLYCMSVYYGSVNVRKTRYTLTGALLATLGGIAASIFLARHMMP